LVVVVVGATVGVDPEFSVAVVVVDAGSDDGAVV
jgi:hypothetical protein